MEKRFLLAIFLVFLFFFVYQTFVGRRTSPPKVTPAPTQAESAPPPGTAGPGAAAPAGRPVAAAPTAENLEAQQAGAVPAATVFESTEREIVVQTRVLRVVFSNRGARATSWRLPQYKDDQGEAVDSVPGGAVPAAFRMFDLKVDDESATQRLAGALFATSAGEHVDGRSGEATLMFEFADAGGLSAKKVFTFKPDSYAVDVRADVNLGSRALNPTVQLGAGLGDMGVEAAGNSYVQPAGGIVHQGGKVRRIAVKELGSQPVQEGIYRYAGIDDHYFLSVVIPGRVSRIEYRPVPVAAPNGKPFSYVEWGVRLARQADEVKLYLGPKDFDVLASVDRELVRTINYGMFDWLAVPLLRALKAINNRVGNYGWSIIVLTVLINLVMFPLRHKSVVSMRKMQHCSLKSKRSRLATES